MECPNAISGEHMPADDFNINMLTQAGIDRLTLLLRDPRDVVVSFWHFLYQPRFAPESWNRRQFFAAGLVAENYYDLERDAALDSLIETYLPRILAWRERWLAETRVDVQIIQYEDLVRHPQETVLKVGEFHGLEIREPVIPERGDDTLFRRGVVGSHKDELSARQASAVNELMESG